MVALFGVAAGAAQASYIVQVGYADDIRPSPFFPSPWAGGANVDVFAGGGGSYDAGAIRIINTGGSSITFNAMTVDSFGDGASFTLWGAYSGSSILPGHSMILTQTASYNFDSSDDQGSDILALAIPRVTLTIDGGPAVSYFDTAQVLNTEGSDHLAVANLNESHQWREIGTFGGQSGQVPDGGSSVAMLGMAMGGVVWLRRKMK